MRSLCYVPCACLFGGVTRWINSLVELVFCICRTMATTIAMPVVTLREDYTECSRGCGAEDTSVATGRCVRVSGGAPSTGALVSVIILWPLHGTCNHTSSPNGLPNSKPKK